MPVLWRKTLVPVALAAFVFAACKAGPKAKTGALGGAAAGGLIGAAAGGGAVGIISGVVIGGAVGGAIGDRMDAADRKKANEAVVGALETTPSDTTATWRNPDSGNAVTITPTRTYQDAKGRYCREYFQTVYVGDDERGSYRVACRQRDGNWKVIR